MKVYVEGKLRTRSWQDDAGNAKSSTEIVADNFTMLTTKAETNQHAAAYPTNTSQEPSQPLSLDMMNNEDDDDLPF